MHLEMGRQQLYNTHFEGRLKHPIFRRLSLFLLFIFVFSGVANHITAHANNIPIISFSSHSQIGNENVHIVYEDTYGYTILGTDHGAFFFDGYNFRDIGPQQGLPDGGEILSIKETINGQIIILYRNSLFLSKNSLSKTQSPLSLAFSKINNLTQKDIRENYDKLSLWGNYILFLKNNSIHALNLIDLKEQEFVFSENNSKSIEKLFNFGFKDKKLFSIEKNGSFCKYTVKINGNISINTFDKKCLNIFNGKNVNSWIAAEKSLDGKIFIRSSSKLFILTDDLSVVKEKDFNESDPPSDGLQSIALLSNDTIVTPYKYGVYYGNISNFNQFEIFPDKNNEYLPYIQKSNRSDGVWVSKLQSGIKYVSNFDQWENIDKSTGLDDDQIWKIISDKNSTLALVHSGILKLIGDKYQKISDDQLYDISPCRGGDYYALSAKDYDVYYKSKEDDVFQKIPKYHGEVFTTSETCADDNSLWIGAQGSIIHIQNDHVHIEKTKINGLVDGISASSDGAVWFLENGHLQVLRNDRLHTVVDKWADANFDPRTILVDTPDSIWVGGSAGPLHHIHTQNDHVLHIETYYPPTIVSNNVVALLKDGRNWLWVGTDRGVSVYDGHRWTGVTTEDGLVSNDIDQNAISLAPDDTIWFGTSRGASHLLHPERIFDRAPLNLAIINATLGKAAFSGRHRYSKDPAEITFGTLNVTNFNLVHFRYRLDGVDPDWVDTRERQVRYPAIAPGKHVFRVYAYDPVSHQTSETIELPIDMAKPWWLKNWALALEGLTVCLSIYGLFRLWNRHMIARERRLSILVAERTREIARAQEALVIQATIDGLTRTLNRGAIQDKLDHALREGFENAEEGLTIGLLDVDHFKQINDVAGHLAGDEVLREFAARLRGHAKPEELVGRYGGEEFLIILRSTSDQGRARLGRLKTLITGRPFTFNNEAMRVTCSVGIAHARLGDTWQTLIARADAALYAAKKSGRDRVIDSDLDLASGGIGLRRARRRYRDAQL